MSKLKRFWTWFTCNHWNAVTRIELEDGWYVDVCERCGRAVVFTESNPRSLP